MSASRLQKLAQMKSDLLDISDKILTVEDKQEFLIVLDRLRIQFLQEQSNAKQIYTDLCELNAVYLKLAKKEFSIGIAISQQKFNNISQALSELKTSEPETSKASTQQIMTELNYLSNLEQGLKNIERSIEKNSQPNDMQDMHIEIEALQELEVRTNELIVNAKKEMESPHYFYNFFQTLRSFMPNLRKENEPNIELGLKKPKL